MMQIHASGLALPGAPIQQADLLQLAHRYNASSDAERARLKRIYRGTKVQHRHSVLSSGSTDGSDAIHKVMAFYDRPNDPLGPTTQERMAVYEERVLPLGVQACKAAFDQSDISPSAITQLVTVSCTGFAAPGLDAGLIDALGLDPTVGRSHLGFMGCHGAINGLRVADALVSAKPDAHVLLCCTELCTLHFQYGSDPQDAVANALFADGAAALIGSATPKPTTTPATAGFLSLRLQGTDDMMSWRIGDHGFKMRLQPQVPDIIQRELKGAIERWLKEYDLTPADIQGWAIHPGGPKIIDAVEQSLGLTAGAGDASREVLRDHGNMSSPTVLFILDALSRKQVPRPWVGLAFGPGLAIEAVLLT